MYSRNKDGNPESLLKNEVLEYGEEEDAIDYVLFIIRESTGKLY